MSIRQSTSLTRFKSDNATKAGVIKATPGQLFSISCHNTNAAARYLRLYNKATAPGTGDTPVSEFVIPGATTGGVRDVNFFGDDGASFSTGIAYRAVTTNADNGDTAIASDEVVINFEWK